MSSRVLDCNASCFDESIAEMMADSIYELPAEIIVYGEADTAALCGLISSSCSARYQYKEEIMVGASLYASVLNGYTKDCLLLKAATTSVLLEVADGDPHLLLQSGCILPVVKTCLCTVGQYESGMRLGLLEDNGKERTRILNSIIPLPHSKGSAAKPIYEVRLEIDSDESVMVSVINKIEGNLFYKRNLNGEIYESVRDGVPLPVLL